jgi:hypothetical protein
MNKSIFLLCLIFATPCFAETYVIYNTDTKEVYSLSNKDDAVMPSGNYTKSVMKESMPDLDIIYPHKFYRWTGTRITPNNTKLDEAAKAEEQVRSKVEQDAVINKKLRDMAIAELKKDGVDIKEE